MPKTKQEKKSQQSPEEQSIQEPRTVEVVETEQQNVLKRIEELNAALAQLEEERDVGLEEERRLQAEDLRQGRPARPNKKLRELGFKQEELTRELVNAEIVKARLRVESAELRLEQAEVAHFEWQDALTAAIEKLRQVEEERIEIGNAAYFADNAYRDVQRELHNAQISLAQIDADYDRKMAEQRAAQAWTPEQQAAQDEQIRENLRAGSGWHSLQSKEDEQKLRAAAAQQGAEVHVGPGRFSDEVEE